MYIFGHRGSGANSYNTRHVNTKSDNTDDFGESSNSNSPILPENTLDSFRFALDILDGVELDAQVTLDGFVIVFHDFTVQIGGKEMFINELTYDEVWNAVQQKYGVVEKTNPKDFDSKDSKVNHSEDSSPINLQKNVSRDKSSRYSNKQQNPTQSLDNNSSKKSMYKPPAHKPHILLQTVLSHIRSNKRVNIELKYPTSDEISELSNRGLSYTQSVDTFVSAISRLDYKNTCVYFSSFNLDVVVEMKRKMKLFKNENIRKVITENMKENPQKTKESEPEVSTTSNQFSYFFLVDFHQSTSACAESAYSSVDSENIQSFYYSVISPVISNNLSGFVLHANLLTNPGPLIELANNLGLKVMLYGLQLNGTACSEFYQNKNCSRDLETAKDSENDRLRNKRILDKEKHCNCDTTDTLRTAYEKFGAHALIVDEVRGYAERR